MNNEQPINRTTDATQRAPLSVQYDNLNIFRDFSTPYVINNPSSYVSRVIRRRRNQRRLNNIFTNDTFIRIRQLPVQNTGGPSINQFFNGITFP
ncbi:hypothetical protein RclHR1_01890018 [Rhizophagus clarus]|uniref:Uncharacterized protein n=1 Tax=Rhizophagus clarus TaxID=94130 RepID=A0A2Z6R1T6_9GLOM|nr:hypothetical protein RclHR1_01890018 [Rhizophagus clarus]GES85514.1 hypothetical protein GLOIN_2v1835724 [Rhizophagus clarus]